MAVQAVMGFFHLKRKVNVWTVTVVTHYAEYGIMAC